MKFRLTFTKAELKAVIEYHEHYERLHAQEGTPYAKQKRLNQLRHLHSIKPDQEKEHA